MDRITSFSGQYRWLSNFYPARVVDGGTEFSTLEHAFQAAKTTDVGWRARILAAAGPGDAKRLGRKVPLRRDWEAVKVSVMRGLLVQKFADPDLRDRLLATGDVELVEGNDWGDRFWGESPVGAGQNWLGRLIMSVRNQIRVEAG